MNATAKQVDFMTKLADEISQLDPQGPGLPRETIEAYTRKEASMVIDALIKAVKELRKTTKPAPSTLEEGLYRKGDTVYLVRRSRSGYPYALKLTKDSTEYVGASPLAGLTQDMKMSTAQAVEIAASYGKSTGICCMCGRQLRTAQSIEQGIGPVCRSRM